MLTFRNTLLFLFSTGLLSPIALADSYTVTVFQCVNKSQKKVNISLVNGEYVYKFGKLNQEPDITLTKKPDQLEGRYLTPKGDNGAAEIYEMDFQNSNYTYTISSSYFDSKHEAQVDVYQKDKLITTINCVPNTVVDNLREHIFDLPSNN
ncbi:hypothetical protein [Proteus vulgaris]|uniref:hypothetical protein n=1 Tax=Proteus vulgaris TaxID=585 RepID=UPI00235E4AF2|nr:hypothetical protein [Proteus vulgaris]